MTETSSALSRRRFLARTALAGAGIAALTLPSAAVGFSIEPADAETAALYLNACSSNAYHARLLADARTALAGTATDAEIERAIALMTCPVCGCPVG